MTHPDSNNPGPNPSGLCLCGCGTPTTIALYSDTAKGWIKGTPVKFVRGHAMRGRTLVDDPLGQGRYEVRCCGYETPCWVWTGALCWYGYGRLGTKVFGTRRAHRALYQQVYGSLDPGVVLDHLCGNRACVNPDHLEPVTQMVNCRRGGAAKLTPDQVREIRALAGKLTSPELAAQYGVAVTTINGIRAGQRWKGVGHSPTPRSSE